MEKSATFINRPLTRAQIRKRFMRSISKKDLDWKNTSFMTKFMNPEGKLYNRFQTRLPTPVHRKMAKIVRKMRNLAIIPTVGRIQPTDKIPLGSYI